METYSFTRSHELFERATQVIPCGIYGHFSPAPLAPPTSYPYYAESAKGAHFTDVDGNDFIDYLCAYGPMVLGYNNKVVEAAAARQRKLGDTMAAPGPVMVELAEKLVGMLPFAAWAFFAKNGGDATSYAIMIARAATGRSKIVAIEGGYHGVAPWMQGRGHHGVIGGDVAEFVRIPWNDSAAFERVLDENPGQVAGFISTPYHHPTFADNELPADGYWRRMRELCDRHGVVLIIDDVRCGFRLSLRGSADYFGFAPDLACYCKAIANGYPISALVGNEAMRGEAARVFYTGSYWYQAVPMAAAVACLGELERLDAPRLMQDYGQRLTDGMVSLAAGHGYHLKVSGVPSMPYLRLTDDPSLMLHQRFCSACARRGAYMPSHHNWFMSCAHTQADLARTLEIVDDAFAGLVKGGEEVADAAVTR
jgi:glutamate-1-semialdehyde 2,1-aminomutase